MSQATAPPDSQSLQTVEHRDWVKKSVARRRGSRRTKPVRKLSRDGRESPADADNRSGAGRNPAAMAASTLSPPCARAPQSRQHSRTATARAQQEFAWESESPGGITPSGLLMISLIS